MHVTSFSGHTVEMLMFFPSELREVLCLSAGWEPWGCMGMDWEKQSLFRWSWATMDIKGPIPLQTRRMDTGGPLQVFATTSPHLGGLSDTNVFHKLLNLYP